MMQSIEADPPPGSQPDNKMEAEAEEKRRLTV
jgi:hypothetical protein